MFASSMSDEFCRAIGVMKVKTETECDNRCFSQGSVTSENLIKEENVLPELIQRISMGPNELDHLLDCKDIKVENFTPKPKATEDLVDCKDPIKVENFPLNTKATEDVVDCKDFIKKENIEEYELEGVSNADLHTGQVVRQYECRYCFFNTSSLPELLKHANCHSSTKQSICPLCTKKVSSEKKLTSHMTNHFCHKDNKGIIHCDMCSYNTLHRYRINVHIKNRHMVVKQVHGCKLCKQKFDSRKRKFHHLKKYHRVNFKCQVCSKKLANEKNLEKHVMVVHGLNPFTLNTLTKAEKDDLNLCRSQVDESIKVFKCPDCPYVANFKYYVTKHLISRHEMSDHLQIFGLSGKKRPVFECDACGKVTYMKGDLRKHIESVHLEKSHKCDLCEYKTARKCRLRSHKKSRHSIKSSLSCSRVRKKYFHQNNLIKHNSFYQISYSCDLCNFQTHLKKQLRKHIQGCYHETTGSLLHFEGMSTLYSDLFPLDPDS